MRLNIIFPIRAKSIISISNECLLDCHLLEDTKWIYEQKTSRQSMKGLVQGLVKTKRKFLRLLKTN